MKKGTGALECFYAEVNHVLVTLALESPAEEISLGRAVCIGPVELHRLDAKEC